ncbi:MAG: DUF3025 domain-containing protein [Aestuariibacter sp.]
MNEVVSGPAAQPYFADIVSFFGEQRLQSPAKAAQLNQLATSNTALNNTFIDDDTLKNEPDTNNAAGYYEQIIFQKRIIPTRFNWHDTFNAMMWMLFPKTKTALNQLHCEDIEQYGLHPRTRRRNRITHFDECGGIIVYEDAAMLDALQNHRWKEAFIDRRSEWWQHLRYYIFGHALYEMLLQPHIGLTGKFLALQVDNNFWQQSLQAQYHQLDEHLHSVATGTDIFASQQRIHPLPLLGIPGWHERNSEPEFYDNTDYFRPRHNALKNNK